MAQHVDVVVLYMCRVNSPGIGCQFALSKVRGLLGVKTEDCTKGTTNEDA